MLPNLKDKLNAIPTPEQAYRDMFGLSGQKITRLKVVDLGFHPPVSYTHLPTRFPTPGALWALCIIKPW